MEAQDRFAEALLALATTLIGLAALLLGRFSRFGAWPQVVLAIVLVIGVKGVESVIIQTVRDNPALWPLVHLPGAAGFLVAAVLLALATRSRRVEREAPA